MFDFVVSAVAIFEEDCEKASEGVVGGLAEVEVEALRVQQRREKREEERRREREGRKSPYQDHHDAQREREESEPPSRPRCGAH